MFCRNCGAENPNNAKFCVRCGTELAINNVTNSYSNQGNATPNHGMQPRQVPFRNIATAIILSIVTCGIYGIIWFIYLTDDTNFALNENDTSGGTAFLLSLVTCGIYLWYWMYKQGEKLDKLALMKGQPSNSRGVLYLVLGLFGLGIVSYALMQDSLNKLAA